MFQKRKEEPVKPRLLGEDFDIFPDLEDRPPARTQASDAIPDTPDIEEDPAPTEFQTKIASIPENKWKLYQSLVGTVLGLLIGVCISVVDKYIEGIYGLSIAFIIALFVPNAIERHCARKTVWMRIVMCIVLALFLGIVLLSGFASN